jgi:hypothetical protein
MLKVALVVTYSLPSARSRLGWGVSVLGGTLRGPMSNVGRNGVELFSCLPEFFLYLFRRFFVKIDFRHTLPLFESSKKTGDTRTNTEMPSSKGSFLCVPKPF